MYRVPVAILHNKKSRKFVLILCSIDLFFSSLISLVIIGTLRIRMRYNIINKQFSIGPRNKLTCNIYTHFQACHSACPELVVELQHFISSWIIFDCLWQDNAVSRCSVWKYCFEGTRSRNERKKPRRKIVWRIKQCRVEYYVYVQFGQRH